MKILIPILFNLISIRTLLQAFDKCLAAAKIGDLVLALQEGVPLADRENAHAQSSLGSVYEKEMAQDALTEATRRAHVCMASSYQDCN